MIGAISLHFSCVSGPEIHKNCNEIAPITVLSYVKVVNVHNLHVNQLVRFRAKSARKVQRNYTNHYLYFVTHSLGTFPVYL